MIRINLAILMLLFGILSAQSPEKYYKVKFAGDEPTHLQLLKLGITIDHSHGEENGLVAEISESELKIVKSNRITHEVLISDMAKFYEERNKLDQLRSAMPSGVCNAPTVNKPSNFHLGSMGGYFTFQEMKNILDSMALLYPNLITVKQPVNAIQSIEGRDIYYVKISDNPNMDENEPEVLYTALHHAREAASLSQLIFYMWYLLENYATDPDVQATLNNTELFFVPCVNPDGYVYNQTTNPNGGGMWRKNRRNNGNSTYGVDLNRNYGEHWGYDNVGSSPTSSSDTYRGTGPFSEPETQAIRNFCNSRQFVTALNAHTYSNLLVYPWGYLPSFYTPDSALFVNWGKVLTKDSRFLYGTGDQTVNYVTNGDSDDWMYGEQISKPKIFSMTPEAGSATDGFWPASSRIIDICKTTFTQNYNLAKLVGNYAYLIDDQDKFIMGNGFLKFKIRNAGLGNGNFTVSINPVGSGIASAGPPKIYSALGIGQTVLDSISYMLSPGLVSAQSIVYTIGINNGNITTYDTLKKVYGTPIVLFNDNGNSASTNYTTVSTWGISTAKFNSGPSSITDSPAGNYSANANKSITTNTNISLVNAVYAHLQYYTRFEIEKNNDKAQVFISTNNGASWSPLCGKYETSPASFGGTNPVYDGFQDEWVKEDIDLSSYIGQNISIRFTFNSNSSISKDGFYLDDVLIRKIDNNSVSLPEEINISEFINVYPNPSSGKVILSNSSSNGIDVKVSDQLGRVVREENNITGNNHELDLSELSNGIYFVKIQHLGESYIKKLIINH